MPMFPPRRTRPSARRRRGACEPASRRPGLSLEALEPRAVLSGVPAILSVTPPTGGGTTDGGGLVTITGNNFDGATAVKFGTTAASIKSVTSTSITVIQPALPVGFQDVTVTTPSGTSAIVQADQYLVDPLTITITNATGLPANTPIYVGIFAKVAYLDGIPANVPLTATGTAVMSGSAGQVGSLVIQAAGTGYAPAVTVAASPGGGTQAVAKATEFDTSGGVTALTVTNNGTRYGEIVTVAPPPTRPAVIPGTSTQASYYADIDSTGAITTLHVINTGAGYQQWFTFGTGATAAYGFATVDAAGAITALTVQNAGSGLTAGDSFSFAGSGTGANVTATVNGGTLASTTVNSGGTGYFYAPTVTFSGGDGKATATATVNAGAISAITLNTPGSGYGPGISVANGTGLKAQAVISGNTITSIAISQPGSGYAPTLTFSPPSGAGTTATAAVTKLDESGGILAASITGNGSGYTATPTVTVGGAGKNAALAAVGAATVSAVTITNPGLGYSSPPGLVFTGGGAWGPPAAGTVSVAAGSVTGVTISSGGQYFSAPTVAFDAPPSTGYSERWVGFNTSGQFGLASDIKTGGDLPTYQLQFTGGAATLQMPNLYTDSVRIVFGVNSRPVLPVESDGSVAAPSMENPTDPNHTVFWDFVEYTLNQQGTLYIDTSAVDQFGIPISVTVDAPDPQVPGGVGTLVPRGTLFGTTPALGFAQYLASVGGNATAAFGGLTTQQGSGTIGTAQYPYRVLAPQDFLVLAQQSDYTGQQQPPQALKQYFDAALQSFYKNVTSRVITLIVPNPNAGIQAGNATNPQDYQRSTYVFTGTPAGEDQAITFTGTVNGVVGTQLTVPAYTSSKTPTTDAFAAMGIFAPGDTGQTLVDSQHLLNNLSANIKNQIASAVNRGIVNVTPASNQAGFAGYLGTGVQTIAVASGGSGYTAAPAVTIAPPPNGPNAAQARGVAVMTGDTVTGVIITDPGNGYDSSSPPVVTFSLPQNAGTTATAGPVGFGFFDTTAWVGTQTNFNKDHLPFYQPLTAANQALGFTPANFYAGYFHATINGQPVSRNNLAYAFPYDDQGNQSSTMVSTSPQSVAITLTAWGSSAQSPLVSAIDTNPPENPPGTPTPTSVSALGSVTWTVTFTEPVKGVTAANFALAAGDGLIAPFIQTVMPSGTGQYSQSWTVTASSGAGSGLLGLNMTSAAGVYDAQSQQLTLPGGSFTGQVYSVRPIPVGPTASIAIAGTNPTNAATVPFTVTFSQPLVTGPTAANFTTVAGGGVTGAAVQSVTGSGTTWTVVVYTGSGSGTLALRLATATGILPVPTGLPVTSLPYTIDKTDPTKAPEVQGIALAGTSPTNAASVSWTVTFTEPVTGLTKANFNLVNGGLGGTPAITGVAPASTSSTATWTVTASTGSGSGTLGLNMVNSTNVHDADSQAVTNVPFTGSVYTIDRVAPVAQSITRADANPTALPAVSWTVVFSEPVSGVTKQNFQLVSTGLGGTMITQVSPSPGTSSSAWTVTALTGSGSGTLQLNLANATGITDAAGYAPTGIPLAGQSYTIQRGGATIVDAPISFMTTAGTAAKLIWLMPAFTDRDSVQITAALSATPAAGGTFRATSGGGVTVTPSGTASSELQFSGTVAALNAYFRNRSGFITYTPTAGSLAPRTLTLSAQGSDGLGGLTTAALLVRAAAPQSPAPTVNTTALLAGTVGQPVVITYAQLVTATGATQTTSRSIQFMLGGLSSGRLEVWNGGRWAVVPAFANLPLLAPGGQIRWTPPAAASGVRAAFTVKTWDGWRLSGLSQVSVNLAR